MKESRVKCMYFQIGALHIPDVHHTSIYDTDIKGGHFLFGSV